MIRFGKNRFLGNIVIRCMAIGSILNVSSVALADDHYSKTVAIVGLDSRPCIFFTLTGVGLADAAQPASGPWFAVPKSLATSAEISALLTSAKLTGKTVTLNTDGTLSCGHATVHWFALD